MIRIGLNNAQKDAVISRYAAEHDIKNIIVFSDERFFMELPDISVPIRQIGYKETEMYRTFYPLLEEIDADCLLVMNECLREKRGTLKQNCIAKYTNQTPHRIVFEYFPIIDSADDFMVLVDFATSQRYKGQGLSNADLGSLDIACIRRAYSCTPIIVQVPEGSDIDYRKEAERLFDGIGKKDPDTIPRTLHVWTGKYKASAIEDGNQYVARNKRFGKCNVVTFKEAVSDTAYIMIDMPFRKLDFNDFLRRTGMVELKYLSTGFKIDSVYIQAFNDWVKEVETIYAKTSVYAGNSI